MKIEYKSKYLLHHQQANLIEIIICFYSVLFLLLILLMRWELTCYFKKKVSFQIQWNYLHLNRH